MSTLTTTRNASLADLMATLKDQQAHRLDVIAPAAAISTRDGQLVIEGVEAELTEDGVTQVDGTYVPTVIFDEGVAQKLGIPVAYLRRLRNEAPDLYDANVNGWLRGTEDRAADGRKFLLRCFRGDTIGDAREDGIARAVLSNSYSILDNWDFALAGLAGVKATGLELGPDNFTADLSDRRMYIKISVPQIRMDAPSLLAGYRSPFTGDSGSDNPVVFAGAVMSNSEVGSGAWSITPRITMQVCTNGMTVTKDIMRGVHLGGKLEEGIIKWSTTTERKTLDLVTAKVTDAMSTFLSGDYLKATVTGLEEQAQVRLPKPTETLEFVNKKLGFSEEEAEGIMADFIAGGQVTAGGVMQAVTAYAQRVTDADAAANLEGKGLDAMALAASYRH